MQTDECANHLCQATKKLQLAKSFAPLPHYLLYAAYNMAWAMLVSPSPGLEIPQALGLECHCIPVSVSCDTSTILRRFACFYFPSLRRFFFYDSATLSNACAPPAAAKSCVCACKRMPVKNHKCALVDKNIAGEKHPPMESLTQSLNSEFS
jgi:hypothetical protein